MTYSEEFLNNISITALEMQTGAAHELDNERKDELLTLVVLTDPAEWSSLPFPVWMEDKAFVVNDADTQVMWRLDNILDMFDRHVRTVAVNINLHELCPIKDMAVCVFCPVRASAPTGRCTARDMIKGAGRLFDCSRPTCTDRKERKLENISDRLTAAVSLIELLHREY